MDENKKFKIWTVTPFARTTIESNANTKACAELCCTVEINAARDILNAVRRAIRHFCPHAKYCYTLIGTRYGRCDDCEYLRERMAFIKDDGNLNLGENFRI